MCDTLCVVGAGRTLFAKNSDRPVGEVQLVESHGRRAAGGRLRTQYLEIEDAGAAATLGSRPDWLWGFEHGVNEHRVAIGNEAVQTVDDPQVAEPALIGMDLVRLGLERAGTADDATEVITALLDEHGQGGIADATHELPYFSSFLIAGPAGGWVLETSGRTWAARPVDDGAAISNRLTLRRDWTRASPDVEPGADFDVWRNPDAPTGHADQRLEATRACVAAAATPHSPRDLVAAMRHHGTHPWGAPGSDPGDVEPPPDLVLPDGTGVSVCMHVRGFTVTTGSMVAELSADPTVPLRAWVAVGSPCASVYVPVFPPDGVPSELADPGVWRRFDRLRERVEADPAALADVRAALAPVESELWDEADALVAEGAARTDLVAWARASWPRVAAALTALVSVSPG